MLLKRYFSISPASTFTVSQHGLLAPYGIGENFYSLDHVFDFHRCDAWLTTLSQNHLYEGIDLENAIGSHEFQPYMIFDDRAEAEAYCDEFNRIAEKLQELGGLIMTIHWCGKVLDANAEDFDGTLEMVVPTYHQSPFYDEWDDIDDDLDEPILEDERIPLVHEGTNFDISYDINDGRYLVTFTSEKDTELDMYHIANAKSLYSALFILESHWHPNQHQGRFHFHNNEVKKDSLH